MIAAARVMDEQTILPDDTDSAVVVDLLKILSERGQRVPQASAKLVSADNRSSIDLPNGLHDILVKALETLAAGYAVTIAPKNATLTTQQAADMLGVSRPTLTKLLDDGKIPFDRPNSHRRIRLADLLAYQQGQRKKRRELLHQLTVESVELGLYDVTGSAEEESDHDS